MPLRKGIVEHLITRSVPLRDQPVWVRYASATLITGAFTLLRAALHQPMHDYSFFLFIPAVLLSALLFGRGPGLWATGLSTLLAVGLFTYPSYQIVINDDDILPLLFFVVTCLGVSEISDALRAALAHATQAEEQNALLLREMEHRTKNNFQIIGSVLATQARGHSDPAIRQILQEAAARVRVIAQAQDLLRLREGNTSVRLDEYLTNLCEGLRNVLCDVRPIDLVVDVERIEVTSSMAVPIGLIVNELVTNAFKYAFPADRAGMIRVSFRVLEDNRMELKVADDGVGYPVEAGEGLGTRLTNLLCRQLNGTLLREDCSPGSSVTAVMQVEA
jgi:two-component sensor histidine kinase